MTIDLKDQVLEALLAALPYVEDVLENPEQLADFKPGVVQKHAEQIREAIIALDPLNSHH